MYFKFNCCKLAFDKEKKGRLDTKKEEKHKANRATLEQESSEDNALVVTMLSRVQKQSDCQFRSHLPHVQCYLSCTMIVVHNRNCTCFFWKILIEHTPKDYSNDQPQLHKKA